ncbi:MAG: hypothetical protein ACMG6E_08395, partial [Candidatus Roizmanbacteria bacterium]
MLQLVDRVGVVVEGEVGGDGQEVERLVVAEAHQDVLLLEELGECLEIIQCFAVYGLDGEAVVVLDDMVHGLPDPQHVEGSPEVALPDQCLGLPVEYEDVQIAAQNEQLLH